MQRIAHGIAFVAFTAAGALRLAGGRFTFINRTRISGTRRFNDFLARYVPHRHGRIVDTEGRTRGQHIGLAYYTIGQRQGLGIGGQAGVPEAPWYVTDKQAHSNTQNRKSAGQPRGVPQKAGGCLRARFRYSRAGAVSFQ